MSRYFDPHNRPSMDESMLHPYALPVASERERAWRKLALDNARDLVMHLEAAERLEEAENNPVPLVVGGDSWNYYEAARRAANYAHKAALAARRCCEDDAAA